MTEPGITLWRRPRPKGKSATTPLLPCDLGAFDFSKPIFFCFSGKEAVSQKAANGFAKLAETLLGGPKIHDAGIQLIVAQYEPRGVSSTPQETDHHHTLRHMVSKGSEFFTDIAVSAEKLEEKNRPYAQKYSRFLTDQIFGRKELIPDLNGLDDKARRAALEHSEAALSHINILSYSFGTFLTPFLHEQMRVLMKQRGFTDEEAAHARAKVHVVSFGDAGLWFNNARMLSYEAPKPRIPWDFTSIHFVSTNDKATRKISRITPDLLPDRDCILRFGERGNVLLFLSQLPKKTLMVDSANHKLTSGKDDWRGHNPYSYAGLAAPIPYVSKEGGQWLIPSALQSAMRQCFYTSLHGGRGDAAALLKPIELFPPGDKESRVTYSREIYMPSYEGYGYARRIEKLLQQSIDYKQMPPRARKSWVDLLTNTNSPSI